MSYDVSLLLGSQEPCPACGHSAITSGKEVFTTNHTSNTAVMWKQAGCDLRDYHGKSAAALAASLGEAIAILKNNMDDYRKYEPDNKWGTLESTLEFLQDILKACLSYPHAVVEVSN